ncbi:MAG: radical SAM protein [candidate division Zixibacteria bacterium SM23_73_3]|nr:MAG: radical SAM protein [candidate division Zixibacteria bacterium SM23_73_3]
MMKKDALFWEKKEDGRIQCLLCPVGCVIADGKIGVCMGRKNEGGILYAINYGRLVSLAIDPIEKKPLYHFHPGTQILSTGPNGCNMSCQCCQNWVISQEESPTEFVTPEDLVKVALKENSVGIAYTYTEPLIWYEYILDTAKIARERELTNVLVTNGYIHEEPLKKLLPLIDAMNIDLKSMDDDFYKKICKAKLLPILRTIELCHRNKIHVEITNLLIPTLNDSDEQIQKLVDFVANLSDRIPLHFSRYFPTYKMDILPTPLDTLQKAFLLGKRKLKYIYVGNAYIPNTSNTYCPECNELLIRRDGYYTSVAGIKDRKCKKCGASVDIVMK